jgi:hypothetical protein
MEIPEDYEDLVPEHLNLVKYESSFTVMNLGSLYFVFLIFCIEGFVLFATRPLTICWPKGARYNKSRTKSLYWNSFLRLILEASLDLSIASLLNFSIIYTMMRDGNYDWYYPDIPFFWMNIVTTFGAMFVLAVGPAYLTIYYLWNFKKWQTEEFEEAYGAILDGLRKDIRLSIFYPVFFMFRRIVFTVQAIFAPGYFSIQIHT